MRFHILQEEGYWASYNNPYFDDIARITGQYQLCQKDSTNCYDTDPRAQIFRANHHRVENVTDLKHLMTYNDYQNDPYSRGDPCNVSPFIFLQLITTMFDVIGCCSLGNLLQK